MGTLTGLIGHDMLYNRDCESDPESDLIVSYLRADASYFAKSVNMFNTTCTGENRLGLPNMSYCGGHAISHQCPSRWPLSSQQPINDNSIPQLNAALQLV